MSGRVSTGIHGWMNDILHKSNMFKMRIERFPDLRIWPCEYFQNLTYLQFSKLSELIVFYCHFDFVITAIEHDKRQ